VEALEAEGRRQWGLKLMEAIDRMSGHARNEPPATQGEPPTITAKKALTVEEAASQLGIGRTVCFGLIGNGTLRSLKVGRRRLVPCDAIDDFLRANPPA